jgi:outer membrane protein TolC
MSIPKRGAQHEYLRNRPQQREATAPAAESLQLFTNRSDGGGDNYLQAITAQTVLLTNQSNDLDIERQRMDASVLLVTTIGGGWESQSGYVTWYTELL